MSNLRLPVLVVLLAFAGGGCGSDAPAAARGEMAGAAGAGADDGGSAGAAVAQAGAGGSDAATAEVASSDGGPGAGADAGGEACAGPTITTSWTLSCHGQPIACRDLGATVVKIAAGSASTTVPCDALDTGGSATFQGVGGSGRFSVTFTDDGGRVLATFGPDGAQDFPACGTWNLGPIDYSFDISGAGKC